MRILMVPALISVVGVIILVAGFSLAIIAPPMGTWELKRQVLADATVKVRRWKNYNHLLTRAVILPFYATKDFVIKGSAQGRKLDIEGEVEKFNFYVFNKRNFDLWKTDKPYEPYFESKDVGMTSFSFSPAWKEEVNDFHFVVEYPSGPYYTRRVKIHATLEWKESRYKAYTIGATVLGAVGTLMTVVGGVTATLKPRHRDEKFLERQVSSQGRSGQLHYSLKQKRSCTYAW